MKPAWRIPMADLAGSPDAGRLLRQSLREDLMAAPFRFAVNTLAGSPLVPRAVRALIYRMAGLDVRTANIYPRCTFVARQISIGRNTFVNRDCLFEGGARLTIGENCQIAMRAMLLTSTHAWTANGFARSPTNHPTTVGNRCWIGAGAIIMPGTTVGDDCVIGAGAVVTGDCEPGWIYAGVPARRIRPTGPPAP